MADTAVSKTKTKGSRDINVDILRVLAALLVIGVHCSSLPENGHAAVFFTTLFADGVPVFFLLAGFFMFRKSFRLTLKRTILHVLIPGLVTMAVLEIIYPIYRGSSPIESLAGIPANVFGNLGRSLWQMTPPDSSTGYLWYVLTYFLIVLAYPLLRSICDPHTPARYRRYIIVFSLVLWFFTDLNVLNNTITVPGLLKLLPWSCVFVVTGYEISTRLDQIRGNRRATLVSLLAFAAGEAVRLMLQMKILGSSRYFIEAGYTLPTFVASVSLVIFFMSLRFGKLQKAAKTLASIGPYTFFIYLIHAPVINHLNHMGFDDWVLRFTGADANLGFIHCLFYYIVRIGVVFLISFILAFLLKCLTKQLGKLWEAHRPGAKGSAA